MSEIKRSGLHPKFYITFLVMRDHNLVQVLVAVSIDGFCDKPFFMKLLRTSDINTVKNVNRCSHLIFQAPSSTALLTLRLHSYVCVKFKKALVKI